MIEYLLPQLESVLTGTSYKHGKPIVVRIDGIDPLVTAQSLSHLHTDWNRLRGDRPALAPLKLAVTCGHSCGLVAEGTFEDGRTFQFISYSSGGGWKVLTRFLQGFRERAKACAQRPDAPEILKAHVDHLRSAWGTLLIDVAEAQETERWATLPVKGWTIELNGEIVGEFAGRTAGDALASFWASREFWDRRHIDWHDTLRVLPRNPGPIVPKQ